MSGYKTREHRERDLRNAVSGVDLTDRDERLLAWLSDWDTETTDALADLIYRARRPDRADPMSATRMASVSIEQQVLDSVADKRARIRAAAVAEEAPS